MLLCPGSETNVWIHFISQLTEHLIQWALYYEMATSASNYSALPCIECWCTLRKSTQKHNCLSPQMVNIVHNLLTNYSLSCSTSISLEEWRFPSGPGAFPNSLATHQSSQRFLCVWGVFGANQVNDHLTAQGTWQEPITALTGSSRPEQACWESPLKKHCFGASSLTPYEPLRISADLSLSPLDSEEFTEKKAQQHAATRRVLIET